jgi:hypothetical protein
MLDVTTTDDLDKEFGTPVDDVYKVGRSVAALLCVYACVCLSVCALSIARVKQHVRCLVCPAATKSVTRVQ